MLADLFKSGLYKTFFFYINLITIASGFLIWGEDNAGFTARDGVENALKHDICNEAQGDQIGCINRMTDARG